MAEDIVLNIKADGSVAQQTVGDVKKELQDAKKATDEFNKSLDETGQEAQTVEKQLIGIENDLRNLSKEAGKGGASKAFDELNSIVDKNVLSIQDLGVAVDNYKNIAIAAGTQTPIGQEALKKAADMESEMDKLNRSVAMLAESGTRLNTAMQLGTAVFTGYAALQGVQQLVGEENEDLAKSMAKLQGVMTVIMSLKELNIALDRKGLLMRQARTLSENLFTKATLAQAVATGTATTAQKILNQVMNKNPIVWMIGLIGSLVGALVWLSDNVKAVGDFFIWMGDVAMDAFNSVLRFLGYTGEAIETQGRKERRLAEQRRKESAELKRQHGERMAQIEEQRDAIIEAKNDEIETLKKEIEINDNLGKSSDELTVKVLEAQLAKMQAVRDATQSMIENWTEYYKREALLAGQSEQEYIESMKKRGIDLEALNKKAQKLLEDQELDVQLAESRITKFKREQYEKRSEAAEKERQKELEAERKRLEKLERLAQQEYDANVRAAEELFNRRVAARDKLHELQVKQSEDEIAILELEYEKKIEKLDETIPEEHELILFYEQELRNKKQELYAQWDEEDKAREQQRLDEEQAARDEMINKTSETANTLISIADSVNSIMHSREIERIKAKEQAGVKLTKSEAKRLKKEETIQKAFAIAQIAKDTALGVSAAIRAGAGVPFPGNILAIASGVGAVLSGIAQAKSVLSESVPVPDVNISDSAEQTSQSTSDPNVPNNNLDYGSTLLNQKVYVVESEITDTQKRVADIEEQASFG